MDISHINDVKELKAMAYDESLIISRSQSNLNMLNERIRQVMDDLSKEKDMAAKDK